MNEVISQQAQEVLLPAALLLNNVALCVDLAAPFHVVFKIFCLEKNIREDYSEYTPKGSRLQLE